MSPDLSFSGPGLLRRLDAMSDTELDDLDFSVIGFDAAGVVRRYGAMNSGPRACRRSACWACRCSTRSPSA